MADILSDSTLRKFEALPNMNAEVTKLTPSVLISDPLDWRIDRVAAKTKQGFKVKSEGSKDFTVVVNPNKTTGFLFWRKPSRIVIKGDHLRQIQSHLENFSEVEQAFINSLE